MSTAEQFTVGAPDRTNPAGLGYCYARHDDYACTRPRHADPVHAAGDGVIVCATWTT